MTRVIHIIGETGEVAADYQLALVQKKRQRYAFNSFGVVNMQMLIEIARIKSATDLRVLLRLLAEIEFDNYIKVNQSTLAHELDILPRNFYRSVTALVKRNILIRGPEHTLRLNANVFYRGSPAHHATLAKEHGLVVINGGKSTSIE